MPKKFLARGLWTNDVVSGPLCGLCSVQFLAADKTIVNNFYFNFKIPN